MAVMTVEKFVSTLQKLEKEPTVYYSVAGGAWCKWNGKAWNTDCVNIIKGVLWGFSFDKAAAHGGAIYASNGVYDDSSNTIVTRCKELSTDFNKIEVGELMYMTGHVGIYIGNRKVVESTVAWGGGVTISDVGTDGTRSKNGVKVKRWLKHGKLPYLDYNKAELKVGDKVRMAKEATVYRSKSKFAKFVYETVLYVRSIDGNKVIVSTLKAGAITGAVHKQYLTKVE